LVNHQIHTGIKELKLRNEAYKTLTKKLQDLAKPLPLGAGPKQAIQADVLAQAESYRQLKLEDGYAVFGNYPTCPSNLARRMYLFHLLLLHAVERRQRYQRLVHNQDRPAVGHRSLSA
jgi:hypothetical protein